MGWFVRERRRAVSWKDRTLDSTSLPPLPLVVFFAVFIMLMCLAGYSDFQGRLERSKTGLRFGLLLLPLLGFLVVNVMMLRHRWWWYMPRPVYETVAYEGSWPWGLFLVMVLLLVLAYNQPSFQSSWFRSI